MEPPIDPPRTRRALAIRPARPVDATRLHAIDCATSLSPRSLGQFAAACGEEGWETAAVRETVLVLALESKVCGFVFFSRVLDEVSVFNIAIHPDRQGQGLGRRLLDAALDQMKRSGATRCLLEVRESNQVARRLYEASGFTLDGARKNYYPASTGREHALLMSRQL